MSNGNNNSKADSAALELLRQLITLSSGVLALSATFMTRLRDLDLLILILLATSWFSLLLSIFFSIQSISCIVQSRLIGDETLFSDGYGRTTGKISKYGFVVGVAVFTLAAFLYLSKMQKKPNIGNQNESSTIINNSKSRQSSSGILGKFNYGWN